MDIDRSAPVVVSQEVVIDAPLEVVWRLHTDVARWTSWRSDVAEAELDGDFAPGSVINWRVAGLEIASTIHEVVYQRRTVWGGPAQGIVGIHVWEFTAEDDGVRVLTEENWGGPVVEADEEGARGLLENAISRWLAELAQAASPAAVQEDRADFPHPR